MTLLSRFNEHLFRARSSSGNSNDITPPISAIGRCLFAVSSLMLLDSHTWCAKGHGGTNANAGKSSRNLCAVLSTTGGTSRYVANTMHLSPLLHFHRCYHLHRHHYLTLNPAILPLLLRLTPPPPLTAFTRSDKSPAAWHERVLHAQFSSSAILIISHPPLTLSPSHPLPSPPSLPPAPTVVIATTATTIVTGIATVTDTAAAAAAATIPCSTYMCSRPF